MKKETSELLFSIGYDNLNATIYDAAEWFRQTHRINVESNYLPNIGKFSPLTTDMDIKPKDMTREEYYVVSADYIYDVRFDSHPEALEYGLCKAVEKYKKWGRC